ncbi:MAG: L-glutamate gamma-semialdehyde dehydrogenase [Proteobacteria bacterium]|nr:L-glutamate gamma-semialdehyde dehydrogenase [Pseudomonadota bacterium]
MSAGIYNVPIPSNEPVRDYAPQSPERDALIAEMDRQANQVVEIPCVIGGKRVFTGKKIAVTMPCDHGHLLANLNVGGPNEIQAGIDAAREARHYWAALPWEQRASVFMKAAELLAGPWRDRVNAATMLGQAKTCHQAEVDSACELIDFWRFNPYFATKIYTEQPPLSPTGVWNRLDHRPLDGFVLAITPFNFTSIAGNLPTAPTLMGNTTIWKSATTAVLSSWYLFQLLEEAGLPPGVLNFVQAPGSQFGKLILPNPELGGIHFTGSTGVFQSMWRTVGENIANYKQYPRIVGETGGKDYIAVHPSADPAAVATAILRGGYEYQGQKCSAASRVYLPSNLWPELKERLVEGINAFGVGDVRDFSNFMGAVIDKNAFGEHSEYLDLAKNTAEVLVGGNANDEVGWFIDPTLVQVSDPKHRLMQEEIFGPIVTAFVYDEDKWEETLGLVDTTSPYALTGAIFAKDRLAIDQATETLRFSAGNFYVNDKPTGAVVGQQPFGGSRASGTNDKAGSPMNLLRWVNQRTIKETFCPPTDWRYPYLG